MQDFKLYPYQAGDRVLLRKAHPCGSHEWEVLKAGADISLMCTKCGHRLRMKRRDLEKATKQVLSAAQNEGDK